MTQVRERTDGTSEVELVDVLQLFWYGRYLVLRFVFVFAIASVALALQLPNQYRSEAKFKAAETELNGVQAGGLLSQVGALTGFADLSSSGTAVIAVETLQSRPFLVDFLRRRDLVVPLMAGKEWNPVSGVLILDPEMYDATAKRWLREAKPPLPSEPADDEIYDRFRRILSVERDAETGIVTVSIEFFSPVLAQQWLSWMIVDLNEQLRRREIAMRERSMNYLTEKLKQNEISTLDDELGSLLKTEIRDHMLAQVREEYALETVAPPYRPHLKSGPNRALITVALTLFGGICGMLFLLVMHARQPYTEQPRLVPLRRLTGVWAFLRQPRRRA